MSLNVAAPRTARAQIAPIDIYPENASVISGSLPYYDPQSVAFDIMVAGGEFTGNVFFTVELIDNAGTVHPIASDVVFVTGESSTPVERLFVLPTAMHAGPNQMIQVSVDSSNLVDETDESNNRITTEAFTVYGAALRTRSLSVPSVVRRGAEVTISAIVDNSRFVAARDFVYSYTLDVAPTPLFVSPSMTIQESTTLSDRVSIPVDAPLGPAEFTLTLDATNVVPENNETNNTRTVSVVIVEGRAELSSAIGDIPTELEPGQRVDFDVTFANRGDLAASADYRVYLSLDPNAAYGATTVDAGTITLTPDAEVTMPLSVTIPGGIAGLYYFGVVIDPNNQIDELDEQNNAAEVGPITIGSSRVRIITSSLPTGVVHSAYDTELIAVGGSPQARWTILSGALPPGLVLDASGKISGEPDLDGTFGFGAEVVDGARTASALFAITIEPRTEGLLQLLPVAVMRAVVGTELCASSVVRIHTRGGVPPLRFTEEGGGVPGLSLSRTGELCGTPTEEGTYNLAVGVLDAAGDADSAVYQVFVEPSVVRIQTEPSSRAELGVPYRMALPATGGLAPYTWSVYAGRLPTGLVLSPDGVIEGEPRKLGRFEIDLSVTDSDGGFDVAPFFIEVARPESVAPDDEFAQGCVCLAGGTDRRTAILVPVLAMLLVGGTLRRRRSNTR